MTSTHMPAWAGSATPESGEALTAANGQGFRGQGTTDSGDCANADAERKRFERLRALLALRGHELHATDGGIYLVRRWGLCRDLRDLAAVEGFARQVGVAL